ncbi:MULTISPECIES: BrnT family toxin [unclassified Aureimonas]|uniref:BrnT family toxin n=1 Tax=unclassified Aureimonas TaxID=2615206 RepID=UPI0006F6A496|nr:MULTISPECIES: BrnT family toxin [unclassified Aureimonas]KQT69611.1 toxin [Aureimonas sp. Leaf427]KQT80962.1 toxin [Aureimonas sp. Leaf460]
MTTRFEYDPAKSASNLVKHGIDFEEAQRLWADPRFYVFVAQTELERRYIGIGRLDDRHWTAIFTHRSRRLRLIYVRRSRALEIERYEGQ